MTQTEIQKLAKEIAERVSLMESTKTGKHLFKHYHITDKDSYDFMIAAMVEMYNAAINSSVPSEDDVTHTKYFGENIKRVKDALFPQKIEHKENFSTLTVPSNSSVPSDGYVEKSWQPLLNSLDKKHPKVEIRTSNESIPSELDQDVYVEIEVVDKIPLSRAVDDSSIVLFDNGEYRKYKDEWPFAKATHLLIKVKLSQLSSNTSELKGIINAFSGTLLLQNLMQVANVENDDGMPVIKHFDKANGGSIAYVRYDAMVKKLNTLVTEAKQQLANSSVGGVPSLPNKRELMEMGKAYASEDHGGVIVNNPETYKAFRDGQDSVLKYLSEQSNQPTVQPRENDLEASTSRPDESSVVSLPSTSGNSIEQVKYHLGKATIMFDAAKEESNIERKNAGIECGLMFIDNANILLNSLTNAQESDTRMLNSSTTVKSPNSPISDVNKELLEALDACFDVMMQPGFYTTDGSKKLSVPFHVDHWIEARARAEKMYYAAKEVITKHSV